MPDEDHCVVQPISHTFQLTNKGVKNAVLLASELRQEIFVDPPQGVQLAAFFVGKIDFVADQVHQSAQPAFIQRGAPIIAEQHPFQAGVVPLDG